MKPIALQNMKQLPIMPGNFFHGKFGEYPEGLGGGPAELAAAGYTVTNFVGIEDLPLCQRCGIKAIVIEDKSNGWHRRRNPNPTKHQGPPDQLKDAAYYRSLTSEELAKERDRQMCDDAELDVRARHLVEACKSYGDTVLGYYIIDEPSVQQFPYVKRICDAITKYDDSKMLFVNMLPTYAYPRQLGVDSLFDAAVREENFNVQQENVNYDYYQMYLDEYVRVVNPQDFFRYDNFSIIRMKGEDLKKDNAALKDYLINLHMVYNMCKKQGIDAWGAVPGAQMRYYSSLITPANLALQVYTALCAGFRGIGWHSCYKMEKLNEQGYHAYYEAAFDGISREPTVTYYLIKEINRQLHLIWPYLSQLTLKKVYYRNADQLVCPYISQEEGGIFESLTCNTKTPLMVGEFVHQDGSEWFMVVNLNLGYPVALNYTLKEPYNGFFKVDLGTGKLLPVTAPHPFCLLPGTGLLCKLAK